jgi:geranylgeranyl pyrophosphate synthase
MNAHTGLMTAELSNMYVGQGHDIFWTSSMVCPSTEQYLKMVDYSTLSTECNVFTTLKNKAETGGLFRILVRLMTAKSTSPSPPDLTALASLLGRYFQIRDDYINLNSSDVRDPTCVLSPDITH